jgi:hypothetical protein
VDHEVLLSQSLRTRSKCVVLHLWLVFFATISSSYCCRALRGTFSDCLFCRNRLSEKGSARALAAGSPPSTGTNTREILLDFTIPGLQRQYASPYGHIRIGRLLEDLDALAAAAAWAYG